jgi:chromatin assembly factor 1 subunit B
MDPRMKSIISLSQDRTARVWKISKTGKKTLNQAQFYT